MGRKIRDAELRKIPLMFVIGDREQANREVAVREHGRGDVGTSPVDGVVQELAERVHARSS